MSTKPVSRTRPFVIVLATVFACLPLLALAQFIAHARTDELDSWLFAYYGREMQGGRMLYRDLWDNKPPGIYWLNALGLWLGRGSLWGVYALCAGAVVAGAALVFAAAKRLYGLSAAAIAAVLAALFLNIYLYHVGCDRPSTFLVPTELACFALYGAALTAQRWRLAMLLLAGFCGGLGPCLHQSGLAMSAAALAHGLYLGIARRARWSRVAGRLFLFGVGWGVAVGDAVLAIYRTSDPRWAWDAVMDFNRLYFKADEGSSLVPHFFAVQEHLKVLGLPLILAAATLVHPLLRRFVGGARDGEVSRSYRRMTSPLPVRPEGPGLGTTATLVYSEGVVQLPDDDPVGKRPDGLLFLLWAWMLAALYLALLGPHQRLHYFGVALPPLVMISTHAVHLLLCAGRRIPDVQPAYPAVVGVLWCGFMMVWPVHWQINAAFRAYYHRFEEATEPGYIALLDAIGRLTGPDEPIFVFGYGPKVYWDTDRRSAIRYIGTEKAGQLGAEGQPLMDEITRLLMEAKPKAIVADAGRLKESTPPGIPNARELNEWIQTNYAPPADYPYENLWIRKDFSPDTRPPANE